MSNVAFYQATNVRLVHGNGGESGGGRDFGGQRGCHSSCLRLMSKSIQNEEPFWIKEHWRTIKSKKVVSCASNSCSSAPYPILASSPTETNDSLKKESE